MFSFESYEQNCIWLKGESLNVDTVWQMTKWEFVNEPEIVQNLDLFGQKNYKISLNKENNKFIKSCKRERFNSKLLIKNYDKKYEMQTDYVLDLDKIPKKKLFAEFIKHYNINFDKQAIEFVIYNAKNLKELMICSKLQELDLPTSCWNEFLEQVQEGWYKKLVNNELISQGILEDNPIAMIQYILRSPYSSKKKAILQFISANIKDGARVWELNDFWKELV